MGVLGTCYGAAEDFLSEGRLLRHMMQFAAYAGGWAVQQVRRQLTWLSFFQ